jgi:hypothetical protein
MARDHDVSGLMNCSFASFKCKSPGGRAKESKPLRCIRSVACKPKTLRAAAARACRGNSGPW